MKRLEVRWQEVTRKRHTFEVDDDFVQSDETAIWELIGGVDVTSVDLDDEILSVTELQT